MARIGCLLIVILLIGIPAVAAMYLPWWGVVLIVVGEALLLIVGGPKLMGYAIRKFALRFFELKSSVLRGASVQVHRVELTEKPAPAPRQREPSPGDEGGEGDEEAEDAGDQAEDENEEEEAEAAGTYYVLVEFTLTPKPAQSKMQHYEPSELLLIPFDRKVSMDEGSDEGPSAHVAKIDFVEESGASGGEPGKLVGPARFRAVFACPPELRGRVKFQYYFETFGDLALP